MPWFRARITWFKDRMTWFRARITYFKTRLTELKTSIRDFKVRFSVLEDCGLHPQPQIMTGKGIYLVKRFHI
jgi:adenylate cyclase class IV